jgi:hypothetical protein
VGEDLFALPRAGDRRFALPGAGDHRHKPDVTRQPGSGVYLPGTEAPSRGIAFLLCREDWVGFRVLSYKWIVESVRDWADQQDQFSITETLADYDLPSCSGVWLWTLAAPDVFSQLMVCREPGRPDEAIIRIGAGGAVGIPEHPAVYRYVATQAWEYPYGAFFARHSDEDNTISVSGRLCLDGRVLETSPVGSGFVVAMARILGQEGRDIGLGLVPSFGGRLHDGTQESDPAMLTAFAGLIQ